MRARIHRGAEEIGGNCVELEAGGARLLLDLGLPLDQPDDVPAPLPPVPGLDGEDPSLLGLVISHPHPDHYGLAARISPRVPVFVGEAAHRILGEAAFFTRAGLALAPAGFLRDRMPFTVGPFRVTPFLADHSAYDAYSLLVEADGRRLFYTGDLRAHGRKAGLFARLLREPPAPIHALMMEGTRVGREAGAAASGPSERDVERACADAFRRADGLVLACFSPQNVDRLVTIYRAARRTGRELVVDLYAAAVAAATGRRSIPGPGFPGVRVYLPRAQRRKVIEHGAFWRTDRVRPHRIYPEEVAPARRRFVLLFRSSMGPELERDAPGCLDGATAIWSMWPGYLHRPSTAPLLELLARRGIAPVVLHASGHAHVRDLSRLVAALAPERVVPIHTAGAGRYHELFPRVERQPDGRWWEV